MTIPNPCYHCYAGSIGECNYNCIFSFESWSDDIDAFEIDISKEELKKYIEKRINIDFGKTK